jgi:hypothetical protein
VHGAWVALRSQKRSVVEDDAFDGCLADAASGQKVRPSSSATVSGGSPSPSSIITTKHPTAITLSFDASNHKSDNTPHSEMISAPVVSSGIGNKENRPGQRARRAKHRKLALLDAQEQRDSLNESKGASGHATDQDCGDASDDAVNDKSSDTPNGKMISAPVTNSGIEKKNKKNRPGQRARRAKHRKLALLDAQEQRDSLNESKGASGHATDQDSGDASDDAVNDKSGDTPDGKTASAPFDREEEKKKQKKKKMKKKSKANIARDKARSDKWLAATAQTQEQGT